MSDNIVQFPGPPTPPDEWAETLTIRVLANGQIIMEGAEAGTVPEVLMWALSDICKRCLQYSNGEQP